MDEVQGPELVIGLISAVGTNLEALCRSLDQCLTSVQFNSTTIHLIETIHELERWESGVLAEEPYDKRIEQHMDAGDEFRRALNRGDALALMAIARIREEREKVTGEANTTFPRHAYLLRSLKNPAEVGMLREIYGSAFILIAGYSPRETRLEELANSIASSHQNMQPDAYRASAERLIYRDQSGQGIKLGQNVSGSFPLADFFVDVSRPAEMESELRRFVEVVFGHPFHTPSRDEFAMFHAKAAALRSSDLGRQVGAVIASKDGDIIAVGTNEVPKAGGGLYWPGDEDDGRNFNLGHDPSDRFKRMALGDIIQRMQEAGWLNEKVWAESRTIGPGSSLQRGWTRLRIGIPSYECDRVCSCRSCGNGRNNGCGAARGQRCWLLDLHDHFSLP